MEQGHPAGRIAAKLTIMVLALSCLWAVAATSARAVALEQVGCFAGTFSGLRESCKPVAEESFGEEVQLGGVGGMAVNYTGAGGVPAGTVYTANKVLSLGEAMRISMYEPAADGGLKFVMSWRVTVTEEEYERCGPPGELPDGETAHPKCGPQVHSAPATVDVDVDQATGNVYAQLLVGSGPVGSDAIVEYSPDGGEVITRFGKTAVAGKTTAETPGEIHGIQRPGGIAVNATGEVFVADVNDASGTYYRVMRFRPIAPGDFGEYEYAGTGNDLAAGFVNEGPPPSEPVVDADGNVYAVYEESEIREYDPSEPSAPPLCQFKFGAGGIAGITVDPLTGSVFFYSGKPPKRIHQLGPCDEATGEFEETGSIEAKPERSEVWGLAFDPVRQLAATRAPGILYGAAPAPETNGGKGGEPGQTSLGYVFAPLEESPPVVRSESASKVGPSSAALQAIVNPEGFKTRYAFQYLSEAAYEANEPDEVQSLTVSATDGLFGLGFKGTRLGGPALATLSSGSNTATSLKTATATATLSAASGSGTLNGASGKGTLIAGSKTITSASTKVGSFEVGQGIHGNGIPAGATITAIKTEEGLTTQELTISSPVTKSIANQSISAGTNKITALSTSEGSFEVGQKIQGDGIEGDTTITAVAPGELTLSKPVESPGSGVALKAGSTSLTSVAAGVGDFAVGQPIQGEGIPAGTTVTAMGPGELRISKPAEKAGTGVAVSAPGPYPLAVGETVEGPGIPAGTTITAIESGQLTLSNPATASGSQVLLQAGLPANADAVEVEAALEGLATIGAGGAEVSGGPGDETGSSPYRIRFTGALENLDVPELETEDLGLGGGAATATVQTGHDGGGGFSGAAETPAGGAEVGEGQEDVAVGATADGLEPATRYRYRVVASSNCSPGEPEKVCETPGAAQTFRTYPAGAAGLPDHRAYELVSPAEKHGGQVFPINPQVTTCVLNCKPGIGLGRFPMQSSPDGESVVYEGSAFASAVGAANENEYLARRTGSGWLTASPTPAVLASRGAGEGYMAFARELGDVVVHQPPPVTLTPEAPAEYDNLYLQSTASPFSVRPLGSSPPPNRTPTGSGAFEIAYAGAAADLSRIFFAANDALTEATSVAPAAEDGGFEEFNLYEWERATGQLRLVNVDPDNAGTEAGAAFGLATANAISDDGSRAFWSDQAGQVYVRENAETTREIPDAGRFLAAATDGSRVLLDDGSLYDLETETTTDLTDGQGGFKGIAGQSDDLSHVYFVDTKILTGGEENSEGDTAQDGEPNLYAWVGGTTHFVATLLPQDNTEIGGDVGFRNDWIPNPTKRTAKASPQGRYLGFVSTAPLTGFDNVGPASARCGRVSGGPPPVYGPAPCAEAFLYDSAGGELICASCNAGETPPLGWAQLPVMETRPGALLPQPEFITDSGRLYFDSGDSLTPSDTNEGSQDVYQWEPDGVGTCSDDEGCVALVSSGAESVDSNFTAADPSGKNVFFTTRARLVNADTDELIDLYDAREFGGFASEAELPPSACQGEGCQPAAPTPAEPPPPSSNFAGPGNAKPTKGCKKGKVKKKGKCVKKHKAKKKPKHKRGGAK